MEKKYTGGRIGIPVRPEMRMLTPVAGPAARWKQW
jgi:hypothetical protein